LYARVVSNTDTAAGITGDAKHVHIRKSHSPNIRHA